MLTRRRAETNAWLQKVSTAAELPLAVHLDIVSAILNSTASFSQLDKLRLVCKSWNDNISSSDKFLNMLRAEKLCALERKAWGNSKSSNPSSKRLPASFMLPFRGNSNHNIEEVRFKVVKTYKRASLFGVEADHNHATAQQVVSLLQTMCQLEGPVCGMLFLLQFAPNSPEDWLDSIRKGAAEITQPTTVQVISKPDGTLLMRPRNDEYTCYLKPRGQ